MKKSMRKMVFILMSVSMAMSVFADVVDTGNSSIDVGHPSIKYGPSSTYNPNGSTKSNLKNLKKRAKDLRKAKKDLVRKKRKVKGREAKKKVQEEIRQVSKELKKVFDDYDFEDGLTTHPRKPKRKEAAIRWKRKQRYKRLQKMKEKQRKWEEDQERKREHAKRVTDLRELGEVTIRDITSANEDVMYSQREFYDIEDQVEQEECSVVNDDNTEICIELNSARTEASANLEESRLNYDFIAKDLPPMLIEGGLYVISDRMKELQEGYKHLRMVKRELINCEHNCDIVVRRVENIKNSIQEQDFLDKSSLAKSAREVEGRRIIRNDDFLRPINLRFRKKKKLGFCCEIVGELTCEGCIAGKRTRKSCKALNKLPGYNFKAFLRASDLSCSKL